jgi:hypothetical protein
MGQATINLIRLAFLLSLGVGTADEAQQFPRQDNPYVPPESVLQRSPCPGLNTLANHGFISRDGLVLVSEVLASIESMLGTSSATFKGVIEILKAAGLNTSRNDDGDELFNLFDLYSFEHDASFVRRDEFFEPLAKFSPALFDKMVETAKSDDVITPQELAIHQYNRIIDSRINNPETFFGERAIQAIPFDSTFLFIFGNDPELTNVSLMYLESFLGPNKFPDGFVPRPEQGLPILSITDPVAMNLFQVFTTNVLAATTADFNATAQPTSAPVAADVGQSSGAADTTTHSFFLANTVVTSSSTILLSVIFGMLFM